MTTPRPYTLLLLVCLTGALLAFSAAAPSYYPAIAHSGGAPPGYFEDRFEVDQGEGELVDKDQLINKVMGALMQIIPEEGDNYMDLKDQDMKKAVLSKKANSICHFKLCNLGKRRRRR